jgi:MAGUK p55 subfamily protein 5
VRYEVKEDRHHPCQEAGLSLQKGEMLRIVDQEDPEWWQAIKEEGEGQEVGLIPSKKYMEW